MYTTSSNPCIKNAPFNCTTWSNPCGKCLLIIGRNLVISTFMNTYSKKLLRKKWCTFKHFGAFSRPTRVVKKFQLFFQTLGALCFKGLFFLVHFLLESTLFQKSSSVYFIQQIVACNKWKSVQFMAEKD